MALFVDQRQRLAFSCWKTGNLPRTDHHREDVSACWYGFRCSPGFRHGKRARDGRDIRQPRRGQRSAWTTGWEFWRPRPPPQESADDVVAGYQRRPPWRCGHGWSALPQPSAGQLGQLRVRRGGAGRRWWWWWWTQGRQTAVWRRGRRAGRKDVHCRTGDQVPTHVVVALATVQQTPEHAILQGTL